VKKKRFFLVKDGFFFSILVFRAGFGPNATTNLGALPTNSPKLTMQTGHKK
jgi:hypothetical protein